MKRVLLIFLFVFLAICAFVRVGSLPVKAQALPLQVYLPLVRNGETEGEATPTPTKTTTASPTTTVTPTATAPIIPPTLTETPSPTPTATPTAVILRPETAFGMWSANLEANGDPLAISGATWVESAHTVPWAEVEPTEGTRNWSALAELEAEIQAATTRGLRVILVVDSTPAWARAVPGTGTHCGPVASEQLNAFAAFITDLVTRYRAPPYQVTHYALWDGLERDRFTEESQTSGCWGNVLAPDYGGSDYAAMLAIAYPALHAAAPDAKLLLGRLELTCPTCGGVTFLDGVHQAGGGAFYDGVRFTTYDEVTEFLLPWGTTTQYVSPQWGLDWFHGGPEVMTKTAILAPLITGKEVFVTGNLACEPTNCPETFPQAEVSYLSQLYAHAKANDWVVLWDSLETLGSPAYAAYQFARMEYGTATCLGPITPADVGGWTDVYGYKFDRQGTQVWVLWTVSSEVAEREASFATLPTMAFTATGMPISILPWVNVGTTPVYVEWWP